MAWNGSGTFSRIVTTVSPAVSGTTIDVADQNNYTADVTAGINACLAKNGENAATGDLDVGSNKITALAAGTLVTDAANVGQVQNGTNTYVADTGSANTYAIALSPAVTAYAAGQAFRFKAGNANTGASTLAVNGLAAKGIKTHDLDDLPANTILANGIYTVVYDGTQFQLQGVDIDVGFSVAQTSGQGCIATATPTQILWPTEVRDPGNNFASNAYTVPTDGVYQFNATVSFATLATGGYGQAFIYVDGSIYKAGSLSRNDSGGTSLISSTVAVTDHFTAGEVITVWVQHTSGTNEDLITSTGYNHFNGTRINLG